MEQDRPTRRDMLRTAGAAGLAVTVPAAAAPALAEGSAAAATPAVPWPSWASDILVRAAGRPAFAQGAPAQSLARGTVEALAKPLEEAVADDYRHGRVEIVDGWVMSQTEMALCRRNCTIASWDIVAACRTQADDVYGQRVFELERQVKELTFLAGGRDGAAPAASGFRIEKVGQATMIMGPTGRAFSIAPGFVEGFVDAAELKGDDLVLTGWAADRRAQRQADIVLIFDRERYMEAIVPTVDRTDVTRALRIDGRHGFTRTVRQAAVKYTAESRLSAYGLSTFGYASRLRPGAAVRIPFEAD